MIDAMPLEQVLAGEPVPQAILRVPFAQMSRRFVAHVVRDHDGLDYFEGLGLALDGGEHLALIRHRGDPEGETTICLPREVRDVDVITRLVSDVLEALHLTPAAVRWQRSHQYPTGTSYRAHS